MSFQNERICSSIGRTLGEIIINELDDERVSKLTTITNVKVAKDLSIAYVHASVLGDKREIEANAKHLNANARRLRGMLSDKLNLRHTPRLKFFADTANVDADAIAKLIDQSGG